MISPALSSRAAWAARLNAVNFLNSAKAWTLLEALGPEGLSAGGAGDWAACGVQPEPAARWRAEALAFDLDGELRRLEGLGARLIVRGEADYPAPLAMVPDAPLVLYAWGRLDDLPAAAVVGTRSPTVYGRRMARRLAAEFARRRIAVVSGLARGIDSEAHAAALDAGGATWAVLGSGLGQVYPPENRDLARRIAAEGGCVLSEFPLSVPPHKPNFPRRNRIVAGLSWATVVVEGRSRSGSLLTAGDAARYGREVFAVPGPADSPLSDGPHNLLKSGARLATRAEDVTSLSPARFGACAAVAPDGGPDPALSADEAKVLRHLGGASLSLEELARAAALDMSALSLIMFGLEIKELVTAVPGQRYAKKTLS